MVVLGYLDYDRFSRTYLANDAYRVARKLGTHALFGEERFSR